jgi:hypothetical protein
MPSGSGVATTADVKGATLVLTPDSLSDWPGQNVCRALTGIRRQDDALSTFPYAVIADPGRDKEPAGCVTDSSSLVSVNE